MPETFATALPDARAPATASLHMRYPKRRINIRPPRTLRHPHRCLARDRGLHRSLVQPQKTESPGRRYPTSKALSSHQSRVQEPLAA